MSIDIKTVGQLLDELITAMLKQAHGKLDERVQQLVDALKLRGIDIELIEPLLRLAVADSICFACQDEIMADRNDDRQVAFYAREAQRHNAERNKYIRMIDTNNGYGNTTVTEKTYSENT